MLCMPVNHLYTYDRNDDAQFYACILQPNDPLYEFIDKSVGSGEAASTEEITQQSVLEEEPAYRRYERT